MVVSVQIPTQNDTSTIEFLNELKVPDSKKSSDYIQRLENRCKEMIPVISSDLDRLRNFLLFLPVLLEKDTIKLNEYYQSINEESCRLNTAALLPSEDTPHLSKLSELYNEYADLVSQLKLNLGLLRDYYKGPVHLLSLDNERYELLKPLIKRRELIASHLFKNKISQGLSEEDRQWLETDLITDPEGNEWWD